MSTIASKSAPATATAPALWLSHQMEWVWRQLWSAFFVHAGSGAHARSQNATRVFILFCGIALFGIAWGVVVAVADMNALYLCVSMVACFAVLIDFRVGVVLLIMVMPIGRSGVFPHAMFGVTGLNPVNLLLAGTLGVWLFHALRDGSIRRFIPHPLLWLYILPMVIAGVFGMSHVHEIAAGFQMFGLVEFDSPVGYFRDSVIKPLFLVLFALLVGAAVGSSAKAEKFLLPTLVSIWIMGVIIIVFVVLSGIGLNALSSARSRDFLTSLIGMHANELGRLYAVAYALLLCTWVEAKDTRLRFALLASMGLIVGALLLTFSRSAFLSFVLVNLMFVIWRGNVKTLFAFVVLGIVALYFLPGAVHERMTHGFGGGLDAISAGRIDSIWVPLLPEVARNPVFGNGLGSILWSDVMRERGGAGVSGVTHPHSAFSRRCLIWDLPA